MNKLYHAEIFIPTQYTTPCWLDELYYTNHALKASKSDRYGKIVLPTKIDYSTAKLIEVETRDNIIIKQVWRTDYDYDKDLIIVVTNDGFVKTVWINLKLDKHNTLDKSKYEERWNGY